MRHVEFCSYITRKCWSEMRHFGATIWIVFLWYRSVSSDKPLNPIKVIHKINICTVMISNIYVILDPPMTDYSQFFSCAIRSSVQDCRPELSRGAPIDHWRLNYLSLSTYSRSIQCTKSVKLNQLTQVTIMSLKDVI